MLSIQRQALLDDPLTPASLRERLRCWAQDQDEEAAELVDHWRTQFWPLAKAEGWREGDHRDDIEPTLFRAAALFVAAGLSTPELARAQLAMSQARDEDLDDAARFLGTLVGHCLPAMATWFQRAGRAITHRAVDPDTAASPGPMRWLDAATPAACGALQAWGESMRDAVSRLSLLDPRADLGPALARQLDHRLRRTPLDQRTVRSNVHWTAQVVGRGLALPGLIEVAGRVPDSLRVGLDLLIELAAQLAVSSWLEHGSRPAPPSPAQYSLLMVSQRDLAQRVDALASVEMMPHAASEVVSHGLRASLGRPEFAALLQALVVWAGFAAQAMLIDRHPPPIGLAAPSPGEPLRVDPLVSPREAMVEGLQVAMISSLMTYAALTARAHAPALNSRVHAGVDRLRQWWRGGVAASGAVAAEGPPSRRGRPRPTDMPPSGATR